METTIRVHTPFPFSPGRYGSDLRSPLHSHSLALPGACETHGSRNRSQARRGLAPFSAGLGLSPSEGMKAEKCACPLAANADSLQQPVKRLLEFARFCWGTEWVRSGIELPIRAAPLAVRVPFGEASQWTRFTVPRWTGGCGRSSASG